MYIDKYLKFPAKSFADAVLYTLHPKVVDEDNKILHEEYYTPNYANVDVIGILYSQDGEELVPMEGWHVNVRVIEGLEDADILADFEVIPQHPRRVWG
jgi:hypothetical protein